MKDWKDIIDLSNIKMDKFNEMTSNEIINKNNNVWIDKKKTLKKSKLYVACTDIK